MESDFCGWFVIGLIVAALCQPVHAATTSANHGHHGGGNKGALGASTSSSTGSSSASGQSGQGGSYWTPNPRASLVDEYQPWPQNEMRQFQKP